MNTPKKSAGFVLAIMLTATHCVAGNLVKAEDYPFWRKLATHSPFYADMKADAIKIANDGVSTRDVMGGGALAYLLDPDNKAVYVGKIKACFEGNLTRLIIGNGARASSVASHQLFHGLLALDVIRDDLDSKALQKYEALLKQKIMRLYIGKWDPHAWAMRMLWHQYAGERALFAEAKREFDIGLSEHYMAGDGVSPAGAGYCVERWNSPKRVAKNSPINVLEYLGHHDYYPDPGIVGLKEFMYGYAVSPFGRILLFGDSRNTETQRAWYADDDGALLTPHGLSAARFSPEAYRYAMWVLREGAGMSTVRLRGHLLNYLVMAGPAADNDPVAFDLDDAVMAPSRLFKNFAALKTREQSTDALYLGMQNLTGNTEYHTHYEVNALAMAGYGEILLRNAGYNGPNRDEHLDGATATFDYMHDNSESANTLMVGGVRHTSQVGAGITEGFVGEAVEYFRGTSSEAIAGSHQRDVVLVQPAGQGEGDTHGYYLVMDHVTTDRAKDRVSVAWHPNAPVLEVIDPEMHYVSVISPERPDRGPRLYSENEAQLTTFLATAPSSIEIKRTVNQSRGGYSYAADYLYAHYDTVGKRQDILTVLFPADKNHDAGELTRVKAGAYAGCRIVQGAVEDLALVSAGGTPGRYGRETFRGENVLFRNDAGRFVSFFVKGVSFSSARGGRRGFKSDKPVALYLRSSGVEQGLRGMITSDGAEVTFAYPEINSVELDGKAGNVVASGVGWLRVQIPPGTFAVEVAAR